MLPLSATQNSRDVKRQALLAAKVIPVLRYGDIDTAAYAAEVAIAAGCTTLELTYTIPEVMGLVKALRTNHGDRLLIGLGTVLTEAQARTALEAGVDFLVSPGIVPSIVELAHAASALCLLGAFTPTEVMTARGLKADAVKIFPAESGGPQHLAALKSVFPETFFCPTGGVTAQNMNTYFKAGAAIVGIGSNLYDKEAFAKRRTDTLITQIQHTLEATNA
jgi:2-dehydro-3-deoxyphosphogluconate aldolase/(4S)-4-hydroxy-2-oxoglutarate aldolase